MKTLRSKGFLPELRIEGAGAPELANLPAILRVLLIQDGTVTKTLEAWFWEFMAVALREQSVTVWQSGPDLGFPLEANSRVLLRKVDIQGQSSGRVYCSATSHILISKLPDGLGERLLSGEIGIGELLRDRELETYRELKSVFWVPGSPDSSGSLGRSYLIHLGHTPVMRIEEHFPLAMYLPATA